MAAPLAMIVPVAAAGAAVYLIKKKLSAPKMPSALDFAAADGNKGPTTPIGTKNFFGNTPVGTIACPATASGPSVTIQVVAPPASKQPKASLQRPEQAAMLAQQLMAKMMANPYGSDYAPNSARFPATPAKDLQLVQLVKDFQTATGINPDGLYGPYTAGALMHYSGNQAPPPPWFYPAMSQQHIIAFNPQ